MPPEPANAEPKAVWVKLIGADLVVSQAADVLLGPMPTPADLPAYDQALAATHAALTQARDAIAAAAGQGLGDCGL